MGSQDKLAVSHTFKGSSPEWNEMKINDYFAFDRGSQPSSCFNMPEFSHIRGVPGTSTVYVGTYSGIYRSDDGGDSWLELDTIANVGTTLSVSPAPVNGGSFARVTTCTYMGGCFWGEVNLKSIDNDESLHVGDMVPQILYVGDMVPQICITDDPNSCDYVRYSVSVDSPTFDVDHISLRTIGDRHKDYTHTQIERSTNDFADTAITLETKIDAATCKRTGRCSPPIATLRVIKFSPNFKEDKTVYAAGVQGLWRSTDSGLTFERLSGVPRAGIGDQCSNCNVATGWTGRDIVLLSFSP